jgi:hypothetical protein
MGSLSDREPILKRQKKGQLETDNIFGQANSKPKVLEKVEKWKRERIQPSGERENEQKRRKPSETHLVHERNLENRKKLETNDGGISPSKEM